MALGLKSSFGLAIPVNPMADNVTKYIGSEDELEFSSDIGQGAE